MKASRFVKLLFLKNKIKIEQHSEIKTWMKSLKEQKPKRYKLMNTFFSLKNIVARYHKLPLLIITLSIFTIAYLYLVNLINFYPDKIDLYFLSCSILILVISLLVLKQIINAIQVILFRRKRRGSSTKLK